MRLQREIQRVQQISIEQAPPTLHMVIVKDKMIPKDLGVWEFTRTLARK